MGLRVRARARARAGDGAAGEGVKRTALRSLMVGFINMWGQWARARGAEG